MSNSFDLTQLDTHSFEHMVNSLALSVLGKGVTGLAQGADGGRDGLLFGEAPYPTDIEHWNGTWYIQSKFHKPHLSKDPQKWLASEIKKEIEAFLKTNGRIIPDIWIIATNIEPSGNPETGAYDTIKTLIESEFGSNVKFDIWGGRKILDFLERDPAVACSFGHFLTPGHVLSAMYQQIGDASAQISPIINHLILDQFKDQIYTKLEQAGGTGPKPKIHELFVDLPAQSKEMEGEVFILETLVSTSSNVHKATAWSRFGEGWRAWAAHPKRARAIILKGGPGQGKSTAGQFFCQIQRASLLLESGSIITLPETQETAKELLDAATDLKVAPTTPRIPVSIELKDFASWFGSRPEPQSKGVLSYLCEKIASKIDQPVEGGTLKRAFSTRSWFFNFDGLDEVPNDVKDRVADEIIRFVNIILPQLDADALILCTTRPQGYSNQFKELNATTLDLTPLPAEIALKCAEGIIRFATGISDAENSLSTLQSAIESPQVKKLMTTPLQSHIMAIVVKDGGRPPEKRWELFDNFYEVMKRRESLKNFPDTKIAQLLRDNSVLLKAIHSRLGISLHSKAEKSPGAETTLSRDQFESLTRQTVMKYEDNKIDEIVDTLMEATVQRLVFVSTPESGSSVRFDVRQLQEFFAAEFLYSGVSHQQLKDRLEIIGGDPHWREVMHFTISALIVTSRPTELAVAISTMLKLDDDDTSVAVRCYKRRIGAGALMTLDLLHEGVLEQDRSVRMQFKDVLTPIYGILESDVTDSLCTLRHPNTLAWLLNCMIDALFELSEPEQINAAAVLAQRLQCTHKRQIEVSNKIRSSSPGYLNGLYMLLLDDISFPFIDTQKSYYAKWFIQLTLELLITESPIEGFGLTQPLRYARTRVKSKEDLDNYTFLPEEKSTLWIMLDPSWKTQGKHDNFKHFEINGVTVKANLHCWKNKNIPHELINYSHESKAPAVYIIKNLIAFALDHKLESIHRAMELSIKYDLIEFLSHSSISPLLPFDFFSNQPLTIFSQLSRLTQSDFDILLNKDPHPGGLIAPTYDLVRFPSQNSALQFQTIATSHSKLALANWIGAFRFAEINNEPSHYQDYDSIALQIIESNPYSMLALFGGWGVVASRQPDLFSSIRPILVSSASVIEELLSPENLSPFPLQLPEENCFLPYVAQALFNELVRKPSDLKSNERALILLKEYGLDASALEEIYTLESNSHIYRTSALCCTLLLAPPHTDNSISDTALDNLAKPILEALKTSPSQLLIEILSYSFEKFDYDKPSTKILVGKMLTICREDYRSRYNMQYLLGDLRERSSAPVSSRQLLESWLNV